MYDDDDVTYVYDDVTSKIPVEGVRVRECECVCSRESLEREGGKALKP